MQIIIAKEHEKLGGIYSIINKTNGKIYWGQTKSFLKRALEHCSCLIKNKHGNPHLQNAYNVNNTAFVFNVYVIENDKSKRDSIEEEFIELFGKNCYNIQTKAVPAASTFSHTPEETRAKMSAAQKGKVMSQESRAKMSVAKKGKVRSEEHQAKISAANKGRVASEEHRAKISAANKGRVHSEESRANMSAAQKGRIMSEETRAKMSAAAKVREAKKKVETK